MNPIIVERTRSLFHASGRDPVKMVDGLATADIGAVTPEQGVYTLFLTAKGRVVADARVLDAEDGLLIDTEAGAASALRAHFEKFVPPLFARFHNVSDEWTVVGVYGEGATAVAAKAVARLGGSATPAPDLPEEGVVRIDGGFAIRTLVTGDDGWDLFGPADARDRLVAALLAGGAGPGDPESLEALRVAAGRPRFGRELTADVIPLEAGLLDRAIDQNKGCYTGQEVIVRILHRGHVNRHLRRLEFSGRAPDPGTELFEEGTARPRGVVTSAVQNDAGALGLGYVRREVEPPAELRVAAPDGEPVLVTALEA